MKSLIQWNRILTRSDFSHVPAHFHTISRWYLWEPQIAEKSESSNVHCAFYDSTSFHWMMEVKKIVINKRRQIWHENKQKLQRQTTNCTRGLLRKSLVTLIGLRSICVTNWIYDVMHFWLMVFTTLLQPKYLRTALDFYNFWLHHF